MRLRTGWISKLCPNAIFYIVYRAIFDLFDGLLVFERFSNLLVYLKQTNEMKPKIKAFLKFKNKNYPFLVKSKNYVIEKQCKSMFNSNILHPTKNKGNQDIFFSKL